MKRKTVEADPLAFPDFLKRPKRAPLPPLEDMNTEPNLVKEQPLELAVVGMNIIETSLYAGSNEETGLHRYLVVSQGTKNARLLYVPTLEHYEIEVRYLNERIASGKARWYALPKNLGQRLIDKAVQWEMFGKQYSRSLVNEALVALGHPPLAMPEAVAGTVEAKKKERRTKAKGERGPGVIDTIISILEGGGGTIEEMLKVLVERFPDRGEGMKGTIKTQLNRLPKQGRLEVVRIGGRYMAKGAAPPTNNYVALVKAQDEAWAAQKAATSPGKQPKGQGKGKAVPPPPSPAKPSKKAAKKGK